VALSSDVRSVEDLTVFAGTEPTTSRRKGDRRSSRLPATKVYEQNSWSKASGVELDTWTLDPHWPTIAPVLESLAAHDMSGVRARLSIGTNARGSGFAFDIGPHQLDLLSRAGCSIWIDSYPPDRDSNDLPDDYPYPVGGTLHPPSGWGRLRRRMNLRIRALNLFGKVNQHSRKSPATMAEGTP
jgi:hypothetical protein